MPLPSGVRDRRDGVYEVVIEVDTKINRRLYLTFCVFTIAIGVITLMYPESTQPGRIVLGMIGVTAGGVGLLMGRLMFRRPAFVGYLFSLSILCRPVFFVARFLADDSYAWQNLVIGCLAWLSFWIIFTLYWTWLAQRLFDFRVAQIDQAEQIRQAGF